MESILYSFVAGSSTVVGAVLLMLFGKVGKKTMAGLLGFAGGIMIALSLFELMPESYELCGLIGTIVGFVLGCGMMFLVDMILPHAHMSSEDRLVIENPGKMNGVDRNILRTGYLIFFGIALHNIPEGMAIGAGLESSPQLGMAIAIAIILHNIPEGLAVSGPLRAGGAAIWKVLLFTWIAGLMTVVGTLIAMIMINISDVFIGGSLAFAAGAMIYVVHDELVPQANALHAHIANALLIVGLLVGFAIF